MAGRPRRIPGIGSWKQAAVISYVGFLPRTAGDVLRLMREDGIGIYRKAVEDALEKGRKKEILKEMWHGNYRLTWRGLALMIGEIIQGLTEEFGNQAISETNRLIENNEVLDFSGLRETYREITRLLTFLSQRPTLKNGRQIRDEDLSREDLEELDATYMRTIRRILKADRRS